jgi:hypothetical protein
MEKRKLVITIPRGDDTIRFISDDKLISLFNTGRVIDHRRVSDVEPWPDDPTKWMADMGRVGGPKLGPFTTRQEALDHEKNWLIAHGVPLRPPTRSDHPREPAGNPSESQRSGSPAGVHG